MNWQVTLFLWVFRPALGLIILAGLFLSWVLKKKLSSVVFLKKLIFSYILLLILFALGTSFLNAWLWSQNPVSHYLLPPYTSITYILRYSWQHYFFGPVVTILFAGLTFAGIYFLNKKFENRFFYKEEKYLAALGILATAWPNCLLFLILVLFLGVIFHLFRIVFSSFIPKGARDIFFRDHPQPSGQGVAEGDERGEDLRERARWASERVEGNISRVPLRLSLLYFWLPVALLILLLGGIMSKYIPFLSQLKI